MKTNVYLAVLMLGVFNASIAVANLAQNPGFETGAVGPGVATAWMAYTATGYPTSEYYVRGETWARHSGAKSQSWYASMPTRGGISQIIPGVSVGGNVQASVYFADPDPLGPYGPTQFRIGVEPSGGLPTSTGVIWGPWMPVIPVWQQASIQATAVASQVRLVMESTNTMAGGPPAYQHAYPFLRVDC